jgi:hypothetical protein
MDFGISFDNNKGILRPIPTNFARSFLIDFIRAEEPGPPLF